MNRHARFLYQPCIPLGKDNRVVTGCKAHQRLAKDVAIEGTVLLKNNGVLPLPTGAKVCLFGRGAGDFLFGGGGSGRVYTNKKITLAEALQHAAARHEITFFEPLVSFYEAEIEKEYKAAEEWPFEKKEQWKTGLHRPMPVLPQELYDAASAFGDTAVFCLSRLSSEHTEYGDRPCGKGDFFLSDEEETLLKKLTEDFERVIVVLSVCGPVSTAEYRDNDRIGAVLYATFGGSMGGEAIADILLGKRYPSGHLQDTLAKSILDYPSIETYLESKDYVNYKEDIFVGYRYFETFCPDKVVYPFGFGLGYTTFSIRKQEAVLKRGRVQIQALVKNSGSFAGKEVVQAYLAAPQGKLGKAAKVLCAFEKTKELQPGEETVVTLRFALRDFGSYDDLGKIKKSAFILECGDYTVLVGSDVRSCQPWLTFALSEDILCSQCRSYMTPQELPERLAADGTMEKLPQNPGRLQVCPQKTDWSQITGEVLSLSRALREGKVREFVAALPDEDLAEFLYGHPMMNISDTSGIGLYPRERRDFRKIPLVPTADGPAGLRAVDGCGILTTQLPCANTVSQTWNLALAKKLAVMGAREVKENNVGIWLTPAMNIHRNPMCGRNFEYYSEDPLISGLFAAETVKGCQSQNIAATVKHFCCNNKEHNRKESDSRVSERALREIYLRGFEIAIKKAKPWALMTAYNRVNGVRSSTNAEAICGILREEWGYEGIVMTDWRVFSWIEEEIAGGSDIKMPEMITQTAPNVQPDFLLADRLRDGTVDRDLCRESVFRILTMMGHLD